MYDKREPYQIAQKALSFNFSPNRYEVWSAGKMIAKNDISLRIQCIPSVLSEAQSEVKFYGLPDRLNIRDTLLFDITFTSNDRIYLATVPQETNIASYESFQSFKLNVPNGFQIETRKKRDFEINEPYVCSVFTVNNQIRKLSFSFGNEPRLIEFYHDVPTDSSSNQKVGLKMAYKLVETLIDEWDDGDAMISEDLIIDILREEYEGATINKITIQELITFINSIVPNQNVISRFENEFMMSKTWVLKTDFRKSDLYFILNKIEEIIK